MQGRDRCVKNLAAPLICKVYIVTKDINQIVIVGNLIENPEIRTTPSTGTVNESVVLKVATGSDKTRFSDNEDDGKNLTTVHEIRIFVRHICEVAKRLEKGDRVVAFGEMRFSRQGGYLVLLAPNARFYKVV